jgi:hypothetical protein
MFATFRAVRTRLLASSLALLACQRPSPTGEQMDGSVREPSGIVMSRHYEGVAWTHGDSGTGNWLFAVDRRGHVLARLRVDGAQNVDWEDIALDDAGHLWLADVGNNASDRRDLALHRITEPDPRAGLEQVTVDRSVRFRYADQLEHGKPRSNFDAESLMWWDARLWLLTKHRGDCSTKLYRFPTLAELDAHGDDELVLEPLASFELGDALGQGYPASPFPCQASAADASPQAGKWALLSYDAIFVFALPEPGSSDLFARPLQRIALDPSYLRQVEALAFDGDELLVVNEERALFRIDRIDARTTYP